jgi:hypothetical protein
MTKITNRKVDRQSYEIYLCLYQAVTGTEEAQNIYKQFSPGLLRPDRDGRVPPRQRRRGFGLARDPRPTFRPPPRSA